MILFQSLVKKIFSEKYAYFYVITASNILLLIALSTLLNSIFILLINEVTFATGFGMSIILDFYFREVYPNKWYIAMIPSLITVMLFYIFGYLGKKKYSAFLLIAFILYFADTLLFVYLLKYLTMVMRGIFLLILYYGWRGALYLYHSKKN